MARPDNPEDYVPFEADDLTVYVSRDLLDRQEPGTRRLRFYIGGYGGYWLEFAEPWDSASDEEID
ncbi:MAG: hypothetical protein ACOC7Y_03145 [Chloroflexota bacterium]